MILVLLVLVILVYLLVSDPTRFKTTPTKKTGAPAQQKVAAMDILKERYARGEIDRETYHAMRKELA